MKKAFITGITGQDGSYLAEFLLHKGYQVHGLIRRASTFNTSRLDHLFEDPHKANRRLHLHYGDLADASRLTTLISEIRPDEMYHLAAQSHVRVSFDEPEHTGDVSGLATTRILEAIRLVSPETKFYQASSSEMFGAAEPPQNEKTSFHPRSPYAVAKLSAYWMTCNYREGFGIHATNGILFNHESPRRGETFVTRKISKAAARIKLGIQDKLFLGNLDAVRDWGYAPEFIEAMWLMLQQDKANDYVVATGVPATVKEFLDACFSIHDLNWEKYVEIDPRYFRPTEVDTLIGDSSRALGEIGWKHNVEVLQLAEIMSVFDLAVESGKKPYESLKWRF